MHLKTREAAKALGIKYFRLISILRSEKIPPPQKDSAGDYIWTPADLKRAKAALPIDLRRKAHRKAVRA